MLPATSRSNRLFWAFLGLALLAIITGALLLHPLEAAAKPEAAALRGRAPVAMQEDAGDEGRVTDTACRLCHADTQSQVEFPSGQTLPAQVDLDVLGASVHGNEAEEPLQCTSCHIRADYQFPHPPPAAETVREYELLRSQTCERCHQQPHITSHPDLSSDNPVVCTDCHSAHHVHGDEAWRSQQSVAVCTACHQEAGVDMTSPTRLLTVIENGLFAQRRDREYCLSCHTLPDLSTTLESGQQLALAIDAERFHDSVHGEDNPWRPLACVDCHEGYVFPHEPVVAESLRAYTLEKYLVCAECHEPKYEAAVDSVHGEALAEGNEEAAVCTDCHTAHYTLPPDEPRERISHTCGQCHSTIFDEYAQSVHGEALLQEGNPDVAVCTDCHGVHNIANPELAAFRNSSPELCGKCHADEEMMAKYDISTDVFDTYVADFHGTTVTLFELQDPDAPVNKAVCFDCHGVHDIRPPDEPGSGIKENLLETCRKCHPDATENFPDAWTSHFKPSLEHNPMVFLVNWFYKIVIPGTVGFLGLLVFTDVYRRIRKR